MVLSMDRWVSKVAVVTGASAGIGAAIAERLVNEGILVVALARRKERLIALAEKLSNGKGKLYPIQADVSKEDDILKAFKWIKDNLGPVHIIVNNAGIATDASLSSGKTEDWRAILDVNVIALCTVTREAIKSMNENNVSGHIIYLNSSTGHYIRHVPGLNMYTASKQAVTALTETLRLELSGANSKIKVTDISPGLVNTDFLKRDGIPVEYLIKKKLVLNPEDVIESAIYVLSTPPHVQVHEMILRPMEEPKK